MRSLLHKSAWIVNALLMLAFVVVLSCAFRLAGQTAEPAPLPATVGPAVLYPASEAIPEGYVSTRVDIPEGHLGAIIGTDDLAHWVLVSVLPETARDVSVVIPLRSARRFIRVHTFLTAAAREAWLATQNFDGGFSGVSGLVLVPTTTPTAAAKNSRAKRPSRQ